MTLLFADGFEDGLSSWSVSGVGMAIGTGRYGNGVVDSGSGYIKTTFAPATAGPVILGFAFKSSAEVTIGGFLANSFVYQLLLERSASGEIRAICNSTLLGTTATGVLPSGAWNFIEVKIVVHDTAGVVVIRVNGGIVLNLTGIDTKSGTETTLNSIQFESGTGSAYDDVYICDSSGSYNNDFLGDLTVEHMRPGSDDTVQWLGSDADSIDNWALIDESGTYSDTDYITSSTVGHVDLYLPVPSARAITSPVLGVILSAVAMKTDVGSRTIKLDIKEGSGGTLRQGSELGLPTTFGEVKQIFERKNDGSQFTLADIHNLRMGIEVAS